MPEVRSLPDDISIPFDGSANLLKLLMDGAIPITHACGGSARCSTCRVRILEGSEACSPRTAAESEIASRLALPDEIRLACQTKVASSVSVQRLVLDAEDEALSSLLRADIGPAGCDRELAVLFADVAGYTSLADALPAYDIVHVLNRFFNAAEKGIVAAGGCIDNYMGDAVMALFGLDDEEAPALAAVTAGLALLEAAESVSKYVRALYDRTFAIRVGVHYGPVVVGALGGVDTRRVTAIGDAVNVASRVEAASKETGTSFLVSEVVRDLTREQVRFGRSFDLELRGKEGRFCVHEVEGLVE